MAGYRAKVVTIAKAFDLKGYVRNLPDGRVKIVAEGCDADLQRFLYDDFFKVAGENETDARLDVAAGHLKELIVVVKDGFRETVAKLDGVDVRLKEISEKQGEMIAETRDGFKENGAKLVSVESRLMEISAKQDSVIDVIDEARADVVSEVQGLRSDLKGRMGP